MLPRTKEDQYVSERYCFLKPVPKHTIPDPPEIYRSSYEPQDPKKRKSIIKGFIRLIRPGSLEEKLEELARMYDVRRPEEWRAIDIKAYKKIMMCRQCRKDHKIKRYYYDYYKELVRPYWDLLEGVGGIEYQEEEDVFDAIKRAYFSLNGQPEEKKR